MAVSVGESVRTPWYRALLDEDCGTLTLLLSAHPSLVMEGWKADLKRDSDGDLVAASNTLRSEKSWKGTTALHAAANRGCEELVTEIIDMFSFSRKGEWLLEDPGNINVGPSADPASHREESDARTLGDLLAVKDGWYNLEPLAVATIHWNEAIIMSLMKASFKCKCNPYLVFPDSFGRRNAAVANTRRVDKVAELRRITEKVVARLNARSTIKTWYLSDETFNQLPFEDNLLPYIFSSSYLDVKLVQKEILHTLNSRVESVSTKDLYEFLTVKPAGSQPPRAMEASVISEVTEASQIEEEESGSTAGPIEDGQGCSPSFDLFVKFYTYYWSRPRKFLEGHERSFNEGVKRVMRDQLRKVPKESMATAMREQIRKATKESMASLSNEERLRVQFAYYGLEDFNFLSMDSIDEYLFLSTFGMGDANLMGDYELAKKVREDVWKRIANSLELKRFLLLGIRDKRGQNALQIAAAYGPTRVRNYLSLVPDGEQYRDWVNPRDYASRTPLYIAAATGAFSTFGALMEDSRVDLNATRSCTFTNPSGARLWGQLSRRNGLSGNIKSHGLTALQIAILFEQVNRVKKLLDDKKDRPKDCRLDLTCEFTVGDFQLPNFYVLEPLALAVWVGNADVVQLLLKDPRVRDPGRPSKWWGQKERMEADRERGPALHFAAAFGNFELVKIFLDTQGIDKLYDPFVRDADGNTAMHHVARGWKEERIRGHLLHLVRPNQMPCFQEERGPTKNSEDEQAEVTKRFIEKQGCVGLLLQAGLDVWTPNHKDEAPYPKETSSEFLSWWYEKLGKETLEEQSTLNAAANAISVTAALVATASYVGPLQPPLSYQTNSESLPSQIQVHNSWVRMFIACNTLSFYLAVGSIILAVIPSLPVANQRVRREIKHTRRIVSLAVGLLFPSIISVLLAFGASSMAVVPNTHGGLKFSTIALGGSISILVICIFSIRILGLVMDKNSRIKKLYGDSIFLDEIVPRKWKAFSARETLKKWADLWKAFSTCETLKKWGDFIRLECRKWKQYIELTVDEWKKSTALKLKGCSDLKQHVNVDGEEEA